jgi:hypothetical protein
MTEVILQIIEDMLECLGFFLWDHIAPPLDHFHTTIGCGGGGGGGGG